MKASITFFILLVFVPVISLPAQSNRNNNSSTYFVRTVSRHGFIPETGIQVTNHEGRSISCKARDINLKDLSKQHCDIESLLKSLETNINCKIIKTEIQLDALNKAMMIGSLKCGSGYGVPVYAMYFKKGDGSSVLVNKVAKGCGITAIENKLINEYIAEFEKPADKNILIELNNTASSNKSNTVADSADKNFEQEAGDGSAEGFEVIARISTEGILHLISKGEVSRVEVSFYKPTIIRKIGQRVRRDVIAEHYTQIYLLTKKSGSDQYDIDIKDQPYKQMKKLVLNRVTETGRKPACTLINRQVPTFIKEEMEFDPRYQNK